MKQIFFRSPEQQRTHQDMKKEYVPKWSSRLLQKIFDRIVHRWFFLYKFAYYYTERYRGDNDVDTARNGESVLAKQVLPHCRIVFDVGSNCGQWAKMALSVNPALTLHCFEPNSSAFGILQTKLAFPNLHLNEIALGADNREQDFYIYEEAGGTNGFYYREDIDAFHEQHMKKQTYEVQSMDFYCQANGIDAIDFVKIDTEGYELEVLKGMSGLMSRSAVKRIQVEYGAAFIDAGTQLRDLFDFANRYQYSVFKLFSDGVRKAKKYSQSWENYQYSNWLLLSPDTQIQDRGIIDVHSFKLGVRVLKI